MRTYRTRPGWHDPLGASWDGEGTNFALYSENATGVDLCLFDEAGNEERLAIQHRSEFVWHVHVADVGPGQRYGYRVSGPWQPEQGLRFNPANVLLDPYARALAGTEDWSKGAFSYDLDSAEKDLVAAREPQLGAPRGLVVDGTFDWGDDQPPDVALRKSVIYEAHVRGLTMRHPQVLAEQRGTYAGLASEPILRHLRELGITAVELMPVHGFVDDKFLLDRGLRNYWGYNSIAFFAPDVRYRSGATPGAEVQQFKQMVKALHAAGIEVILDVVYNHTAEGNQLGPTFSFKGIDNPTYYRLVPETPRYYFDYTGTGSTLNVRHPQTLRLLMDSLRYWAAEMHVDGFRFDLAATLARGKDEVDQLSSFFTVIRQDPIVSRCKLIAEPWDIGADGYQVGRFPLHWAEWNGRYRDTMRAFWRGEGGKAADLGYRLTGSSDLYRQAGRSPSSSINFITAHDGFTLHDLVSYEQKHNQANGEENRDGTDDNRAWNCGFEGETADPGVQALRQRQCRNFLATLLLSQGTPMICSGDETGRTQAGNNNAYCQDNETTWQDWSFLDAPPDDPRNGLMEFTRNVIRLRRDHALIQRANFFEGREIHGVGVRDLVWFRHDGQFMTDEDWNNPGTSSLGVFMAGSGLDPLDEEGNAQADDDLLLALNASDTDLEFMLPAFVERGRALGWTCLLDTAVAPEQASEGNAVTSGGGEQVDPGARTKLPARSLKLFGRKALGPGGLQAAYGVPISTYRLQLRPGFGFREARGLVEYLAGLGFGGVYCSPFLRPEHGSTHGYDVVDHTALNPELGSMDDFRQFTDALAKHGLQHMMDLVPNHVGIGSGENAWWLDVLENGEASLFADHFDIEWHPPAASLQGKILLPMLGRQYGEEIEEGKIAVRRDGGAFWITYEDKRFPVSPRTYLEVLEAAYETLKLPVDDAARQELQSVMAALRHLPPKATQKERAELAREKEIIKRRLQTLCRGGPEGQSAGQSGGGPEHGSAIGAAVDAALASLSSSPDNLEAFLGRQHFRLSYWRVATEEINYRRFFDVNGLAAIRMEDQAVFAATHGLVLDLVREGRVTSLRLDHTDGLYDPEGYFQALQSGAREARRQGGRTADEPLYAIAEKIREPGEELPRAWAVSGTTGYDFLEKVNGLWVDPAAEAAVTQLYSELTGSSVDYSRLRLQAKRDVMDGSFSSEIHVLGQQLKRIADLDRGARDFTLPSLIRALKELIAALPVYRTYVRPDGSRQKSDELHLQSALALAKENNANTEASIFEFLGDILLLKNRLPEAAHFAMRFQQLSGPIMAKGVEDTAFYRYTRLLALNEVGSDPSRFGESLSDFHQHNTGMLGRWPLSMTTTSTHDTKRSEDVRARLAVLSEMPEEWSRFVRKLDELTRGAGPAAVAAAIPKTGVTASRADAYFFYQELIGVFPFGGLPDPAAQKDLVERLSAHMQKVIHEAKVRSSWVTPNQAYDAAVDGLVRAALGSQAVLGLAREFVDSIASYGAANSVAQLALRLAAPGIPDVYQGCETWSFRLVDPDNRGSIDHAALMQMAAALKQKGEASPELARELLDQYTDGRIKMFLTATGLRIRRSLLPLFLEGIYTPLDAGEHVVAFERRFEANRLICVVPRFSRKLTGGTKRWAIGDAWGSAALPLGKGGKFRNAFTGETLEGESLPLSKVLGCFPVAWLLEGT